MLNKYIKIFLLISVFILGNSFIGCSKKDTNNTSGDNKTETPNMTDQQKQDKQPAGENKTGNELGISEGLPKDYPSDVPQPKNSKNMGYLTTSEGTVVTFESDDKPKDIYESFSADIEKNGYKKDDSGALMSDQGGLALWKKDAKECSVMIAWDKDKNKASVVVTYK
jgi:hypothetical protein